MRRSAALALVVAACGPRDAMPVADMPAAPSVMPAAQGLTPDEAGLQPGGTALRIDFGRAEAGVVTAVSRLLGAPPAASEVRADCAGGAQTLVSWPSGLTLGFRAGSFVGWRDASGRRAGEACGAG